MFDAETTALLRTVLGEVCENISVYETGARTHVASKILEAAANGQLSIDDLKAGSHGPERVYHVAPTRLVSCFRNQHDSDLSLLLEGPL
jgi:hypothetical protein